LCGASAPPISSDQFVDVSGGVHKPGRYEWVKGMTAADAIRAAGGFTDSAGPRVKIHHRQRADEMYSRKSTNAPPLLDGADKLFVPIRLL